MTLWNKENRDQRSTGLTTCAILARTGVSTTTFYEWRTLYGFPAPIIGDYFDRYDVERWLEDNCTPSAPLLLTGPKVVTLTVPALTSGASNCEDALNERG